MKPRPSQSKANLTSTKRENFLNEKATPAFFSISHHEALKLVVSGQLKAIGTNRYNINNGGEFTISACGKKLYKKSNTAHKATYHLIAKA